MTHEGLLFRQLSNVLRIEEIGLYTVKSRSNAGSYTISRVQLLIKQFDSC